MSVPMEVVQPGDMIVPEPAADEIEAPNVQQQRDQSTEVADRKQPLQETVLAASNR